jgi:hypothetical protein
MNDIKLSATNATPEIYFSKNGNLEITGKAIPDAEIDFWTPIQNWFSLYIDHPAKTTNFRLQIDYLNTSSSKEILQMLYRLNELKERGFDATVHWAYHECDIDMLEVGRDYEHMVKVPFVFLALSEENVV